MSKLEQVLNKFTNTLDTKNDYTIKDLNKILDAIYKEVYNGKKKSATGEKKPPSKYNLFIKSEIEKIKQEKIPDVDPKDYMKIAAQRWKTRTPEQQ